MSVEVRARRHGVDVELSLDFADGPVVVLFGPSGAGKTTVLRALAGLDGADDGHVTVDGQVWSRPGRIVVPAHRRRVGYLFQDHALFPHLDATANVAFGVRARGADGRRRRTRVVQDALAAAGASHLAGRAVGELSGGEAQRVALARALAREPRLLLLDEPLSALDAPVRRELGQDLRGLLLARGVPTLLVTHDRTEALRLGDTAVVVDAGGVLQVGGVAEVFDRPVGPRAAAVVGVETALAGRLLGRDGDVAQVQVGEHRWWALDPGGRLPTAPDAPGSGGGGSGGGGSGREVLVCIRAEDVAIALPDATTPTVSTRNQVPAVVTALADEGPLVRVDLDARGAHLVALVTRPARQDLALAPGAVVVALVRATAVHLVPRVTPHRSGLDRGAPEDGEVTDGGPDRVDPVSSGRPWS